MGGLDIFPQGRSPASIPSLTTRHRGCNCKCWALVQDSLVDCKGVGWHDGHLQHYRLSTHRQGFLRASSNKLSTLLIISQSKGPAAF